MIYPQSTNASGSGPSGKRTQTQTQTQSKTTDSRKNGPPGKKGSRERSGKQQLVQWKQKNVKEGIVIVDELQLSKLIKREPIEKYYTLDVEPFATGLFATVRRCVSRENGAIFAAKFSSRARYGEDCSAEIHHEIALLSLCAVSPRIVKLHDVFQTTTEIIILMEFAPGGDLQTIIDDNLVPFEPDVVNFIRQLVEGLAYLHERKIAHLDIKPQNLVMMGDFPNCDVKLCDFEISRVILEGTEIREILGTPDYVAPEILHYEPITMAADLWSLGVTAYVLLTGFSPFGGETDQETFCNISRAQLDFPEELFEDVSEDAKDFITKLLVREPHLRPSAKTLLGHKWLAQRHAPKAPAKPTPQMSQKNLRKYLSKSREALFERVVQHQDLRKSTLLSQQYNQTRLCESHMSLVSKSRENSNNWNLSPSFSRSREKLYGLRSLSKSHEGLDLLKLGGGPGTGSMESSNQGGRSYTRATTSDLSILPSLRLHEMALVESNDSLEDSQRSSKESLDCKANEPDVDSQNSSKDVLKCALATTAVDKEEIENMENIIAHTAEGSLKSNTAINKIDLEDNSNNISRLDLENGTNPSENINRESLAKACSIVNQNTNSFTSLNLIVGNNNNTSITKPLQSSSEEQTTITHDKNILISLDQIVGKDSLNSQFKSKNNLLLITKESKLDNVENIEETSMKPLESKTSALLSPSLVTCSDEIQSEMNTKTDESKFLPRVVTALKKDDFSAEEDPKKSDEDEPKFSVAQLISAYNRHQEIVTKSSLEVTMTANDKDNKIPPIIVEDPKTKFPTGPTALRLFIPDIEIEARTYRRPKKPMMRLPSRNTLEESTSKNDSTSDQYQGILSKCEQNIETTEIATENRVLIQTDFEVSSHTVFMPKDGVSCNESIATDDNENSNTVLILATSGQVLDKSPSKDRISLPFHLLSPKTEVCSERPPKQESTKKDTVEDSSNVCNFVLTPGHQHTSIELTPTPSYLRSGSLTSESSGCFTSESSGSISWEEHQLTQLSTTKLEEKTAGKTNDENSANSWGKLCNGSYTRAMERFKENVEVKKCKDVVPVRKCSLVMLEPLKQNCGGVEEKVRRKSTSTINDS